MLPYQTLIPITIIPRRAKYFFAQDDYIFTSVHTALQMFPNGSEPYKLIYMPIPYWSDVMARKSNFKSIEFVRTQLGVNDKKTVDAWLEKNPLDIAEFIDYMIGDQYKVSVSLDDDHSAYIVSLIGKPDNLHNANLCMSSRGPDLYTAFGVTAYKHVVMFDQGSWGAGESSQDNWG